MSVSSHANRDEKRHEITVLLPSPTVLGFFLGGFSVCLLIFDFSTPKWKSCILGRSREAGTEGDGRAVLLTVYSAPRL